MTEPMAARLTTRLRALAARGAYDGAVDDGSFERRAAAHFDIVDEGNTYVALITADATGTLRILVASDLVSLPRLPVDATGGLARRSAVAACDALASQLLPGERSCTILVHDGNVRLVVLLMLHYSASRRTTPFSQWASLDDLAHTPLWRVAIFAFAYIVTFMRADHGRFDKALGRMVGTRGVRALRPLATRPYTPPPEPAHWPQQLHVLECVDAALRAALQARPRSDSHHVYLLEWVYQVDTTSNALTPHALRGARQDYTNPKLVNTPFPDAAPSAKTDPIQFPRAQRTTYKSRKLTDILYPWAIKKLAKRLRDVVADLRAWLKRPKRPRRQAKPLVIGQDGFLPEARHIVWDLENMLVDERGPYFAPVDFTEATGTSLNTEFLDKALEHCDDQGLRSMLVHGFVSGFDAELQIVVLPHLLSLALGVAFSDDFKDFFNQLYLHPSQRWLSTLIWLQLGANGPAYSHVMELCLGFGCNVSSNYAQRFAHELVRLFCLRFDAEEKAILNAETDPSQRV